MKGLLAPSYVAAPFHMFYLSSNPKTRWKHQIPKAIRNFLGRIHDYQLPVSAPTSFRIRHFWPHSKALNL